MKCINCNGEWHSPKGIVLDYCPFCKMNLNSFSSSSSYNVLPAEVFWQNELCGYRDTKGVIKTPCKYAFAYPIKDGMGLVKTYNPRTEDEKYGFVSYTGEEVVTPKYNSASQFNDGMALVGSGPYGFINRDGKEVIPIRYEYASSFNEGYSIIKNNGKFGYIDCTGTEVIVPQYEGASCFYEGLATVSIRSKNGEKKYGYINKNGKLVIPYQFDNASLFKEGYAMVEVNGKFGIIDTNGNYFFKPILKNILGNFENGAVVFQVNENEFGILYKDGRSRIIEDVILVSEFYEGVAAVWLSQNRQGYINKDGVIINKTTYVNAYPFKDGLARVKTSAGKWGYIDKIGDEVIPPQFEYGDDFINGIATVKMGNKCGYINKKGNWIIESGWKDYL